MRAAAEERVKGSDVARVKEPLVRSCVSRAVGKGGSEGRRRKPTRESKEKGVVQSTTERQGEEQTPVAVVERG